MRNNRNKRHYSKGEISKEIVDLLKSNPDSTYSSKSIINAFGSSIKRGDKHIVEEVLFQLSRRGTIERDEDGNYNFSLSSMPRKIGKLVSIIAAGGFVSVPDMDKDVIVSKKNLRNALPDDEVEVAVYSSYKEGRLEGTVTRIVKRADKKYVGVIEIGKNTAFVIIDNRNMFYDIYVSSKDLLGAKDGDKVVVEIIDFSLESKSPSGRVLKVLGKAGSHNAEIHAILEEFDLPYEFGEDVISASEKVTLKISQKEIDSRRDFREVTTMTIDPADAKDFDDALSIREVEGGNYEIGVHIADVSHYIKPGSILDDEAIKRATSVYLVDRVVPMLPEVLSNGVCSLRPNEDKLCFSAVFIMNNKAEILERWFGRTIINSNRRFAYEDAQQVIEGVSSEMKWEITTLDKLAKIMRQARFDSGSIAFDRAEPKFRLDDNGAPVEVYFKEMKDANHLIEEFMLLANKSVAEHIGNVQGGKAKTFVYRVHDKPNSEKFASLSRFVAKFGYKLNTSDETLIAQEISSLLSDVKGESTERLFTILALRSMSKAFYTIANIGHYGLCFDYYSHFTSPIRRYPDIMAHRLLQKYLDGGRSASKEEYERLCQHSSEREVLAAEAERASIKYKMVEFMADKIDQEFDGSVSGITEWGVYIELDETHIEGMVSIRDMMDDTYTFDKENYCYIGNRYRKKITLGDKMRIRVLRIDLTRKVIDFEFVLPDHVSNREIIESSSARGKKKRKKQ